MGEARIRKTLGLPPRGLVAYTDPLPSRLTPAPDWHLLMAFLTVWRQGVRLPEQKGHCIFATRLAAEILRRLEFAPEPVRVWMEICRVDNADVWVGCPSPESKAWSLFEPGVDPVTGQPGQFMGHIVLRVGNWFLEVAAAQFASPQDRITPSKGYALRFWPWAKDLNAGGTMMNILKDLNYMYTPVADDFDTYPWRETWDRCLLDARNNITPEILEQLAEETRRIASETTATDYI